MIYRVDSIQIVLSIAICLAGVVIFLSIALSQYRSLMGYAGAIGILLFGVLCMYTGYREHRLQRQEGYTSYLPPASILWAGILIILMTIITSVANLLRK